MKRITRFIAEEWDWLSYDERLNVINWLWTAFCLCLLGLPFAGAIYGRMTHQPVSIWLVLTGIATTLGLAILAWFAGEHKADVMDHLAPKDLPWKVRGNRR